MRELCESILRQGQCVGDSIVKVDMFLNHRLDTRLMFAMGRELADYFGKDEPDIFRQAVRRLCTEKDTTLIFEDALYAMKTAKRDGFKVVGVFDKFEENPDGVKALADIYLSDYTDFDLALI